MRAAARTLARAPLPPPRPQDVAPAPAATPARTSSIAGTRRLRPRSTGGRGGPRDSAWTTRLTRRIGGPRTPRIPSVPRLSAAHALERPRDGIATGHAAATGRVACAPAGPSPGATHLPARVRRAGPPTGEAHARAVPPPLQISQGQTPRRARPAARTLRRPDPRAHGAAGRHRAQARPSSFSWSRTTPSRPPTGPWRALGTG